MWFDSWISVGKSLVPRCDFVEKLRAQLFEEATREESLQFSRVIQKMEMPTAEIVLRFENPKQTQKAKTAEKTEEKKGGKNSASKTPSFLQHLGVWFWRFGMGFGGLAAAFFVVSPFFSVPPVASTPSLLQNIQGEVSVERQNTAVLPQEKEEIFATDSISTKNGSAELIFFEGTAIRLAENTTLKVENLAPHPFLFASGGVKISLQKGKIWVKTFHKNIEDMGVVITTPDSHIFPSRAGFLVEYDNGINTVSVYENSVQILAESLSGIENRLLEKGQNLSFSLFEIPQTARQNDSISDWVLGNINKDVLYTQVFIQNLTTQMQEKFVMEQMNEKMRQFFAQNPSDTAVEKLFSDLNSLVMISELKSGNMDELQMEKLSEAVGQVELNNENVLNAEVKNIAEEAKKVVKVQKKTEKKLPMIFATPTPSPVSAVAFHEVIDIETPALENTPKTAQEVYSEYSQKQEEEKIKSAVESFSSQVSVYTYETARENQARLLVEKIEVSSQNAKLLKAIEESAPRDVKRLVRQKRIQAEKQEEVLHQSASETTITPSSPLMSPLP